jgi:phenol hydroxylase P2 protein
MTATIATPRTTSQQPVFIALQANNDTQPIVEAIQADNPHAVVHEYPAMVKIDAPGYLVVRRSSIEERIGRSYDLREVHINLISLSGEIDETDDEFTLQWQGR